MDSILFWNAVALEANRISHTEPDKRQQNGPALSSRALAIVHLAMYDAFAAVTNQPANFPRYLALPPLPPGVNDVQVAVAGAAYRSLSRLFSAQIEYFKPSAEFFDANFDNAAVSPSFQFGSDVADALLAIRAGDPGAGGNGYIFSLKRYRHRVDPDNPGQGVDAPFYGSQSKPFAVSARLGLDKPPVLTAAGQLTAKYVASVRQVRREGIKPELMATLPNSVGGVNLFAKRRTPEQTLMGIFWGYDGANRLGTPPRFYNQIIRQLADKMGNDVGQNARLFAFVNAAMGDAGIFAWEQKFCHDFWRPVLGIREHDEQLGPLAPHPDSGALVADGDAGWLPLGAPSTNSPMLKNFTPNFPAYPSGHATFGAAALHVARLFYGIHSGNRANDTLLQTGVVSDEYNGGNADNLGTIRPRHVRNFNGGLWQMIQENAMSRIFLGVHWIFDAYDFTVNSSGDVVPDFALAHPNIGGVGLGVRIAESIFAHGNQKAPMMSPPSADPPLTPPVIVQPSTLMGCAEELSAAKDTAKPAAKDKKSKAKDKSKAKAKDEKTPEKHEEELPFESPYPGNISSR